MSLANFKTAQELFWFGEFGENYIDRNKSGKLFAANLDLFSASLRMTQELQSCIEFGANIGMNLKALSMLFPNINQYGVEINPKAASLLSELIGEENVFSGSILDCNIEQKADLVFTKGVLIHINPDSLSLVYQKMYDASRRYILIVEYYNSSPVSIPYRQHQDRLFKRDFCGEMLDQFPDLVLLDYGFRYKRDPNFAQDDVTWFLMEKRG